ncbi:hypothetical protein [Robertkochia aurantiaca]|uniref:hypothetical protein n=1 Tax=Robertkochia aurantiaca TaxID=2873700 RepID=UPI001CCC400B|nr:hypothetical protein [Robertkochia sp. 3YJGBD-33]
MKILFLLFLPLICLSQETPAISSEKKDLNSLLPGIWEPYDVKTFTLHQVVVASPPPFVKNKIPNSYMEFQSNGAYSHDAHRYDTLKIDGVAARDISRLKKGNWEVVNDSVVDIEWQTQKRTVKLFDSMTPLFTHKDSMSVHSIATYKNEVYLVRVYYVRKKENREKVNP